MIPKKQKPQPGDILVYWATLPATHPGAGKVVPSHIAMVGESTSEGDWIIHNTINSRNAFSGAVAHKASVALQGHLNLPGTSMEVYRCKDRPDLAEKAARFGHAWVDSTPIRKGADFADAGTKLQALPSRTEKCSGQHSETTQLTPEMNAWIGPQDMSGFRGGRSPYSADRLLKGQQQATPLKWDTMSAFRAVKAYVRECMKLGLSPRHGTSCDQFVMYCYQAASLSSLLGETPLDSAVIDLVASNPKAIKLYVQDGDLTKELGSELEHLRGPAFDDLRKVLARMTGSESSTGFLPQAMSSDAKTSSVQKLYDVLKDSDSGFELVGAMLKNGNIVANEQPGSSEAKVSPNKATTSSASKSEVESQTL